MTRQCDCQWEWEINSGNSDALCHDEGTYQGDPDLRNTEVCKDCPYNYEVVEVE